MRIALVNPIARNTSGYHRIGSLMPQLGLQVLARLTPPEHEVDIIDETVGDADVMQLLADRRYDLVAVTAFTSGATRAYELASHCRRLGVPNIFGGVHASSCPEEARRYFDSVAIGECDTIWANILADAQVGQLKSVYYGKLTELADPDHDWGAAAQDKQPINGRYDVHSIQTSRGCPMGCKFCSVTRFNGPKIRRRRIEPVLREWNSIPKGKFVFVVDDNFFGLGARHAEWAKHMLRRIISDGNRHLWFSQTTINMGDDTEALRLAYKAGCRFMLVGFESFNPQSLAGYHKGVNAKNLSRYRELVRKFHDAGIAVFGGFIIGSDDDTPETTMHTCRLADEIGVDIIQITNLTPLPGTELFDELRREGRLLTNNYPADWERHTFIETVFKPKRMTAEQLDESIFAYRWRYVMQERWVLRKTLQTLWRTRSLTTALAVHHMNKGFLRMGRYMVARDRNKYPDITRRHHRLSA